MHGLDPQQSADTAERQAIHTCRANRMVDRSGPAEACRSSAASIVWCKKQAILVEDEFEDCQPWTKIPALLPVV